MRGLPGRFSACAALVLSAVATPLAAQAGARADWLAPCEIRGLEEPAFCGRYQVWEDRAAQAGRRIGLYVVVVPALGADPAPDPLFYFAGGPGASAASAAAGLARAFAPLRKQRDLVLVDIRGTGQSHLIQCEFATLDGPLQAWFDEFLPDDKVRACKAKLDADVAFYSNISAMDDINEVRAALGYERINMYGGSGGTRSIQVYLKRHPETVRAVVMKGVVPMDMENPLPHARSLETSVAALIEACEHETACAAAYPDLRGDWARSKAWFDQGSVEATVTLPRPARTERIRIDRGTYADGVRHILYSIGNSRRLPGMIHEAAQGRFDQFAQRELEQAIGFSRALSYGAFLSSTCAEDLRFVTEDDVRRATEGTFLGDYRVRRQLAACRIWGFGEDVGVDFQSPVRADVPALLISGAVDAVTSAEGAERVARALPRARHVVFPNQSHDTVNPTCERELIVQFIRTADASGLDTTCVAATTRPPFAIAPQ